MSPEYSYIRTYIEWMLDVPWNEKTNDTLDLKAKKSWMQTIMIWKRQRAYT